MNGISPLQPEQIISWVGMKQIELNQDEVELILELDRRYRVSMNRELERDAKRKAAQKPQKEAYGEMGNG